MKESDAQMLLIVERTNVDCTTFVSCVCYWGVIQQTLLIIVIRMFGISYSWLRLLIETN